MTNWLPMNTRKNTTSTPVIQRPAETCLSPLSLGTIIRKTWPTVLSPGDNQSNLCSEILQKPISAQSTIENLDYAPQAMIFLPVEYCPHHFDLQTRTVTAARKRRCQI